MQPPRNNLTKRPLISAPVVWNQDERALLTWLEQHVKDDGCLAVSDTALLAVLGWPEKRFFAAKNRLLYAGAIGAYIDGDGNQLLHLLMPERNDKKSQRYVFVILPLELVPVIRQQVKSYRKRAKEGEAEKPVSLPGIPVRRPNWGRKQERGMERLGVKALFKKPPPA